MSPATTLRIHATLISCLLLAHGAICVLSQSQAKVGIDWTGSGLLRSTTSTPTLQLVVNPLVRRESAIHDAVFQNLANLNAEYTRFVPWLPYPRLAVAELNPPDINPRCAVIGGTPTPSDASTITLSCQAPGAVISSFDFISYGTVTGRCQNFVRGSCDSSAAPEYVRAACLNQPSCQIHADTPTIGDPCVNVFKVLAVQYRCSEVTNTTSWDFSLIDEMMEDVFTAQGNRSSVINFSTIPEWLFATPAPVAIPTDPNEVFWNYEQGTGLVDPSREDLGAYYGRLAAWYSQGGFIDEAGNAQQSGHYYNLTWWEVLNEVDSEHATVVQDYTARFDTIATAIHKVSPSTKFVGLALAYHNEFDYYRYFLNHSNHSPEGAKLIDAISFHFYASPNGQSNQTMWPSLFFSQADTFIQEVNTVSEIRDILSPDTWLMTNELGAITGATPSHNDSYWNLCGAMYAYLYGNLAREGVHVVGESQLVGYPTQYPDVSMVDWTTGAGNARYWVLKMLIDSFGSGPKDLFSTQISGDGNLYAQGFIVHSDNYPRSSESQSFLATVLVINKDYQPISVSVAGASALGPVQLSVLDESNAYGPYSTSTIESDSFTINALGVAVLKFSVTIY